MGSGGAGRSAVGGDGHSGINHPRLAIDYSLGHGLRDGDHHIGAPGGEVNRGEPVRFQNPAMEMPDDLGLRGGAREPADGPSSKVQMDDGKLLGAQAAPKSPSSQRISTPRPQSRALVCTPACWSTLTRGPSPARNQAWMR